MDNYEEFIAYAREHFPKMQDYSFIPEKELEEIISALCEYNNEYMEKKDIKGGGFYDDDEAYELIFPNIKKKFPSYEMYAMRMTEDFLDVFDAYLDETDSVEWE